MAVSALDDKTRMPDSGMIAAVIKETYPLWDELVTHVKAEYPNVVEEWKHYGKASGWTFKLLSKKRNLLFLVPLSGCFRVRFVLGEKAVADAEAASLPNEIKEAIREATPHTEGRSIDIDVIRSEQLETVKKLLEIKYNN